MIYLDHNATAPLSPAARAAMLPWLGPPANPMSAHAAGRAAAAALDQARAQVAARAHWPREGVFFTSGATEANAWALREGGWVASAVEHPSVLAHAARLIPVDGDGRCWPDPAHTKLLDGAIGVSLQLANNETGVLQPISEWSTFCRARGLLLHIDASQAPGRVPIPDLAFDRLTLSSHKAGGPAGVGALLCRKPWPAPLLPGGPQERARRAGTHNVAGIVGMGAALDACGDHLDPAPPDRHDAALLALGAHILSAAAPRLPNTTCAAFDGIEAQDLVLLLDLLGLCASAGAACASGSPERSHVLRAMSFPGTGVRFSLGPATSEQEIDLAIAIITEAVNRLRG